MELKQENDALKQKLKGLLIVPYGIETHERNRANNLRALLIVPYGIETFCIRYGFALDKILLIVPYGIETFYLIVPNLLHSNF